MTEKEREAFRKDVERAFFVLVLRSQIWQQPCRLRSREEMLYVIKEYILIQNIVVEACRDGFESGLCQLKIFSDAVAMVNNEK